MRAGVDEPYMRVCSRRELGSGARERVRAGETRAKGRGEECGGGGQPTVQSPQ